jgi:hypothetical protein
MRDCLNYIKRFLSVLFVLISISAGAQEFVAKSSVNNDSPELNESIEVSYILFAKGNSVSLTNPKFEIETDLFTGFKVERHGQARGSMIFNMGSRDGIKVYTYKYILKTTKLGDQIIPGLTISLNGIKYNTKPIKIKVSKEITDNSISTNLELRLVPNKNSCYIGETVRYDLYYYSAYDIWKINLSETPEFNGFIAEFIESSDQAKTKRINGIRYNVQKVGSYLLTPIETGVLRIPSISCVIAVSTRRGIAQETVKSKVQSFKVKQLPAGAPKNFKGLVGELSLTQKTDKKVIPTNDAVTTRITIKGSGNIASMEDISLKYPSTFEALPPTGSEKINSTPFGFSGYKTFEFIAIPRQPGKFKIPSVEIPYFNPKIKKYQTLKSQPVQIKVIGKGVSNLSSTYSNSTQQTVNIQGNDIRYLKTNITLSSDDTPKFYAGSLFYYLLSGIGIICFLIGSFIFKEKKYSANQIKNRTKNKANKVANKKLRATKKLLNNDSGFFYTALDDAISDYLKEKLMLEQSQMNKQVIQNILREKKIADEVIQKTVKISEQCKMARFSPVPISKSALFEDAKNIINQLENLLK